jgi:acyl carrier protein
MIQQTPKPAPSKYFLTIQAAVCEITGIDPEDISTGMEFDELSMTPVELSEFFARLTREFEVRIKPSNLEDNPTLGELADYIEDELE